jgi:hypothetical protein
MIIAGEIFTGELSAKTALTVWAMFCVCGAQVATGDLVRILTPAYDQARTVIRCAECGLGKCPPPVPGQVPPNPPLRYANKSHLLG